MFISRHKIPWIILFFVLLTIFMSGNYVFSYRFDKELVALKQQSKNEMGLISELVKDRLQRREYQQIKTYVSSWVKHSPDIVYVSLVSENGYVLAKFEVLSKSEHVLIEERKINYSYDGVAKLVIHKSIDEFYKMQRVFQYQLLSGFFFVGLVFISLVYSNQQIKKQKRNLAREINERKKLEADLLDLNINLENRVNDRTSELKTLNEKIGSIARSAGMAEVASGVLHNIGNVLNSVNVSTSVLYEQVKNSKINNLQKVVEMLEENQFDLPMFLTADEKGKQIPKFLSLLSEQLIRENNSMAAEIGVLSKSIEHIKNVISMQQSYAGNHGIKEKICIANLIADALKINELGDTKCDIDVVENYAEDTLLYMDKHKIMQILINIISNAKYALIDSHQENKKISIDAFIRKKVLYVEVRDNGVGIDSQDIKKLFSYGFTRRHNGHGFGLHNSALVANELGGKISVHSEGMGKGACFTLNVPIDDIADG